MKNLVILFLIAGLSSCAQPEEPSAPNVIIIYTDDQGYNDVGCFGSPDIETPYLDQMAMEGVKMTSFYAPQAVCSASRAGLLTGCYPNRIGIHNAMMPNSRVGINHNETTMAEMLRARGYATGIFGKWHLGDHPDYMPLNKGFDEYFGIPYSNDMWPLHPQQGPIFNFGPLPLFDGENVIDTLTDQSMLTTQITERSIDFIKRNVDKPFFLYVPHPQPHVPLYVSDKFKGKSERGLYGDVIMEIDWSVGQIMKTLKEKGIDDNTIVIFTSDNGPWLAYGDHSGSAMPHREGKGTAWEGGQREPFIIRYPNKLKANQIIDVPAMGIDLLPTIAHWTGATLPVNEIDGRDISKVLSGETNSSPQEAYFFYYKVNELHAVRSGDWKLYFPHVYRSLNGRPGGEGGLPGRYDQNKLEEMELYNLIDDPEEQKNIISDHPDIVDQLSQMADIQRKRLGDALTGVEGTNNRTVGEANWGDTVFAPIIVYKP